MRKQTKLWTTKDGRRIRICDMDDGHLHNSIDLLERAAAVEEIKTVDAGIGMLNILQGEMAIDSVERELDRVMDYGIDPSEVNELYDNLIMEKERRKAMFNKTFYIAGVQHHKMHKVINKLEEGDTLSLVPEPTNKFDPNAIRIICPTQDEDVMCGFVPKTISAEVAAQITIGTALKCEIVKLEPDKKPWEQCQVTVEEVAG